MIDFVVEVVLYLVFIQYLSVSYHLFDVQAISKIYPWWFGRSLSEKLCSLILSVKFMSIPGSFCALAIRAVLIRETGLFFFSIFKTRKSLWVHKGIP